MEKIYLLRENSQQFDITTPQGIRRGIWQQRNDGCKLLKTSDIDIQMAIENRNDFGVVVSLCEGKKFTSEEISDYFKKIYHKYEDNTADNVVGDTPDMGGDKEADKGDMEKISGVNTIQKVYAFFDARGISYAKPLTVAKAKELAAQNNIVFVDYK